MTRPVFLLVAVVLIASAGLAADRRGDDAARRDLATALAGHVAGKTVECIDPQFASGPQIIGHDTLLYRNAGTIWRNTLIGPCPSLDRDVTLITDIHGGQLCRDDRFRTLEPGLTIPSSYCRLGDFTEYKPAKR